MLKKKTPPLISKNMCFHVHRLGEPFYNEKSSPFLYSSYSTLKYQWCCELEDILTPPSNLGMDAMKQNKQGVYVLDKDAILALDCLLQASM